MDRTIRARDRTVNQIKAINSFTEAITINTNVETLETRVDQLEKRYKDFNEYELELLSVENYKPIADEIDEIYLNTTATLKAAINSRSQGKGCEPNDLNATLGQFMGQQQSFIQGMSQNNSVRLPKITMEPFSGDYKLWPSFHDLYLTSVHNNTSISSVHKLQILNGLLRGEAAGLIRHIKVTDQNYDEAWAKLVARYNKPKSVVFSLIQMFLEQKNCNPTSHRDLRKLCDTSDEVIRGLRGLGGAAEQRDPWLIHLLANKLDADTRQRWATESVDEAFPTFENFMKFLNTRCDALESCSSVARQNSSKGVKAYHITPYYKSTCTVCNQDHPLFKCQTFKSMHVEDRIKFMEESNRCTNCLRQGHKQPQCFSRSCCLICKGRHHSLLHKENTSNLHAMEAQVNNQPSTASFTSPAIAQGSYCKINEDSQLQPISNNCNNNLTSLHEYQPTLNTLLPTALIYIKSNTGKQLPARVLLDSGSQATFITEACVQRLGLTRNYAQISIYGLASTSAGRTRGRTTITIQSRVNPNYTKRITALIIEKISSTLPSTMVTVPADNKIWKLELADPTFNRPSSVDLLIGAEHFLEILSEQKTLVAGMPSLHNSKFGWLIAGNLDKRDGNHAQTYNTTMDVGSTNEDILELLSKFWKIEEPVKHTTPIEADDPCEILYRTTTKRSQDGRFIVRLPFNSPIPELGESQHQAVVRMKAMERKFSKSPEYQRDYKEFINEYIDLGHMVRIDWEEVPKVYNKRYFMPHHAIYKESTTTKLRVVFDASCKTSNAVSLNDCLRNGRKLQPDLVTTLLKFRQHIIAINADIEKMYRQILVDSDDNNYQLILWRNEPTEALNPYKCLTLTYGTTCAPFLATRCLEELATENESNYPEAAKIIRSCFYMDDLLTGSSTVEGAIQLKSQLTTILSTGGFKLRKWKSNSPLFLHSLTNDRQSDIPKLIEDEPSTKTLGIMWYPQTDNFTFKINTLKENEVWTKRKFLSESSKLYDPLGWLSPIIIQFKIILQKLWLTKIDWDERAPEDIVSWWSKIYYNLPHLQQIQIPRCLTICAKPTSVQLHAFCDASEMAYGCVIYLRTTNRDGSITCRIVCSKSKVAPLKKISLPRLELCGAVLLAELVNYCKITLQLDDINIYAYTDSMVVLYWLSDIPARWKTFIANRTSSILDIIPREHWNHIVSKQNPADYISRGILPNQIYNLTNWWQGPSWLSLCEAEWPKQKPIHSITEVDTEERTKGITVLTGSVQNEIIDQLLTKYSSWFKIKKILCFILRFRPTKYKETTSSKGYVNNKELMSAENYIIHAVQKSSFSREINRLKNSSTIEPNSSLIALDPFIDPSGILRVGGRLRNANISYTSQHPIILPKDHAVSRLIINEVHIANLHAGNTLMMSILRQKYWIIGARVLIKRHITHCVTCIRYRSTQLQQKMGDLPAERCNKTRPFLNTGVDYLGPIYIKTAQHRNASLTKSYVALFICLAVKSVHLEVVSSLTTESFLAALKRFVSRRGLPNNIWCDNGSNFIGANNELKRLKLEIIQQQTNPLILNFLLQKGINFKFIPANAPHFGGLWESAVKSVKHHFKRVTNESKLNFEELNTLMAQIESVLNSRPLCRLNDEPTKMEMLTPGHFLIGEAMLAVPEPIYEEIPIHKLSRWQNIQRRLQAFWKSWSRDYLHTLQQRTKWPKGNCSIKLDDIVLVKENNLPPNQWLLGRITQLHPGTDDVVRVVTIKTAVNTIKRPVTKLVLLPIKTM